MPETIVLDTNIISYQFRNDAKYALYAAYIEGKICCVSFQTRAEIERWIVARVWGQQKKNIFFEFYAQFVEIPHSLELSKQWALASCEADGNGRPIPPDDAWIAATALELGVPLVTHNKKDFIGVERLEIISFSEEK
jgi:tRNA(fMet)-specific endonuclease VapC